MTIPDPEVGLVVHFNYLWDREREAGREEARYARPCAIVISFRRVADGARVAMLAPITHAPPRPGDQVLELPQAVKRQLGLDEQRSWIVLDEVNETLWPGFDLQTNSKGDYAYGFVPPRLYAEVKTRILDLYRIGELKRVTR